MHEIGKAARGPGRIYLVGGATALLLDIRPQTIDIDIKLDPEPPGVFEAIAVLKNSLNVSIEIASPDQYVPALPGWQQRSEFIGSDGPVDFFHYDFYGQALAKLLRGHEQDLLDVSAYVDKGKVIPSKLLELFLEVEDQLIRFPAINIEMLLARVRSFVQSHESSET